MITGNPIVDAISEFDCSGHFIPISWYRTVTKESGRPNYGAIAVLAELLAWYTPKPIYNSKGLITDYQPHFQGDYLPRSYAELSEALNLSKQQVYRAIVFLENLGIVKRHYYEKYIEEYKQYSNNNLMLELIPEGLSCATGESNKRQETRDK